MMTDRITATHLQRAAIVYVRQSSPEQVRNHAESTRIQIGLRDKAVAFGWHDPVTIVDDLGISAAGFAHRAGFQHMAAEVSLGHIGIILCFEASRLSRNSKDWAQLFEVCGHLDTLVADLDQVYDLALPDDRLILGVKGSISEYELSLFRQRSQAAIVAKAQRGALTFTLPAGLSWTPDGQIELNPDRRVQQAIRLVLDKLSALGSVRQVLMWLRDERVALPTLESERPRAITWRLPTYRMVLSMVRRPFYAGAYAFGRRESRTRIVDGRATRTSGHHKPLARWTALIRDHHPGYISWEQFERNQRLLEENTHMKGTLTRKAGRGGQCLLAGLLRCARCGRMLHVMYGRRGYARYECRQGNRAEAAPRCIGFSARRPDETVSAEILAVAQGSALQAAIEAGDLAEQHHHDQHRALALELEQAHYQAALAARRYAAVDPDNRLVAAELEARWNGALARVAELEDRLTAQGNVAPRFVHVDRATLESLATDLRSVWEAPSSEMRVKQRIARLLIHEIIANTAEDPREIVLLIHWVGGRHSSSASLIVPLRPSNNRSLKSRGVYTLCSSISTTSASAQSSSRRCQSAEDRASRATSRLKMAPTRAWATSSASPWNPSRHWALAPLCPRSSSMTATRSAAHPKTTARSRNAYCRAVDSRCSRTCLGSDCRRYITARRSRWVARILSLIVDLHACPEGLAQERRPRPEQVALHGGRQRGPRDRWRERTGGSLLQLVTTVPDPPQKRQVFSRGRPRRPRPAPAGPGGRVARPGR